MSDYKVVQCFGKKIRKGKPTKECRKKFLWTAFGMGKTNFGRRGAQACPNCGTLPDFSHPYNMYLNGDLTFEEAAAKMPDFEKEKNNIT